MDLTVIICTSGFWGLLYSKGCESKGATKNNFYLEGSHVELLEKYFFVTKHKVQGVVGNEEPVKIVI